MFADDKGRVKLPADAVSLALTEADQSTTERGGKNCRGYKKCVASKAIDGLKDTGSVTLYDSNFEWWSAKLPSRSRIDQVIITTNSWAFGQGFFNSMTVEAGDGPNGPWRMCKNQYKMCKPFVQHVIPCKATVGSYIRLGVYDRKPLYLSEVEVKGKAWTGDMRKYHIYIYIRYANLI